jgi:phosphotransferase system HPr (HPr) family protein
LVNKFYTAKEYVCFRNCAKIVLNTKYSKSKITFYQNDNKADTNSILGLCSLCIKENDLFLVSISGVDEQETFNSLNLLLKQIAY